MTVDYQRSIAFGGYSLAEWTTAEARVSPPVARVAEALEAPGGSGLVPCGTYLAEREIRVRLFLDVEGERDLGALSAARVEMSQHLAQPSPARLRLPGAGEYGFEKTVLTDATQWDSLFEDGSCELTFTAYDPRLHGKTHTRIGPAGETYAEIENAGSAPARPVVSFTAGAGESVSVRLGRCEVPTLLYEPVTVVRPFAGGEKVKVDCELMRVTVNGEPADADVTLESHFFEMPSGICRVEVGGGTGPVSVTITETWL